MATNGRTVYNRINDQLSELKNETQDWSSKLRETEGKIDSLMNDREDMFGKIANLYLPELTAEAIKNTLKERQADVRKVFEEKQKHREELETKIEEVYSKKQVLTSQLDVVTAKIDDVKSQRDALRVQIGALLEKDTDYQELTAKALTFRKDIPEDEKNLVHLKKMLKKMLPVFEKNKVFMYLLKKGYGTEDYATTSGTIQKLDAWAAKMVHYDLNKENYDTLTSIPEKLAKEIEYKKKTLEKIFDSGNDIEEKYSEQVGLTAVMAEGRKLTEQKDEMLAQIKSLTSLYKQYTDDKKYHENTKDEFHDTAIKGLKSFLKSMEVSELLHTASRTPMEEDDRYAHKIVKINEFITGHKGNAKAYRRSFEVKNKLYTDLDDMFSKFKSNDYEDSDSRFKGGLDIDELLKEYVAGKLDVDDLWSKIRNAHYVEESYRPPTYTTTTTTYHTPGGSLGSGWGSRSSGSSFGGGGGFRTGGSFGGGGGFRTGGKF